MRTNALTFLLRALISGWIPTEFGGYEWPEKPNTRYADVLSVESDCEYPVTVLDLAREFGLTARLHDAEYLQPLSVARRSFMQKLATYPLCWDVLEFAFKREVE